MHGVPTHVWNLLHNQRSMLRKIASHMSQALALWPVPSVLRPAPSHGRKGRPRTSLHHSYVWLGRTWKCSLCGTCSARKLDGRCPGKSALFHQLGKQDFGHDLWWAPIGTERFLVFCNSCASSAEDKVKALGARCSPPSVYGKRALGRIRKGLHPFRNESIGKPLRLLIAYADSSQQLKAQPGVTCSSKGARKLRGALPAVLPSSFKVGKRAAVGFGVGDITGDVADHLPSDSE